MYAYIYKMEELMKELRKEKLAYTPPSDSDSEMEEKSWYPKPTRKRNKKVKNTVKKTVKKNNRGMRKQKALVKRRKSVKIGGSNRKNKVK
jgi:ribosomal protein S21